MTEGVRPDRVAEEFREILSTEIPKLKDPRVGFVTVTGVHVTPDLRKVIVRYSVLGEDPDRRATQAALRSAKSHLRSVLGRQVRMKFTPDLVFEEEGASGAGRVEELLEQIRHSTED